MADGFAVALGTTPFGATALGGAVPLFILYAAVGIADADAFGDPASSIIGSLASLSVADGFGVPTAATASSPAGIANDDTFGTATPSVQTSVDAFSEVDHFGAPDGRLVATTTGVTDEDLFGLATPSTTGLNFGLVDPDGFGLIGGFAEFGVSGFADTDRFGSPWSPENSRRRTSILLPLRVNILRSHLVRDRSSVETEWRLLLVGEPADIQPVSGSLVTAETGVVSKHTYKGFFDPAAGLARNDRVIAGGNTYRVERVSKHRKFVEAGLERIV